MEYTRIETGKLTTAVEKALKKIEEARAIVEPYLVLLTDAERAGTQRAREGFPEAGRKLARAMIKHPNIAAVTSFDSDAVVEDLNNVAALNPIGEAIESFARTIADSKLTWMAEAWVPSLAVYSVAKTGAKQNAAMSELLDPLAPIFATQRAKKPDPTKTDPTKK